jgi:phospholipase D1/2
MKAKQFRRQRVTCGAANLYRNEPELRCTKAVPLAPAQLCVGTFCCYDVGMFLRVKPDRRDESPAESPAESRTIRLGLLLIVCLMFSLAVAWRWTPLQDCLDFATIVRWQESLKGYSAAVYWIIGAYLIGSLVLFPVTILSLATVIAFGPLLGNVYALAGWLCSAAFGYAVGRRMGCGTVRRITATRLQALLERAGRHGFLTVLSFRLLPIAPFSVANWLIGASGIGFGSFFLATLLGRIPGIITLALFGVQLENLMKGQMGQNFLFFTVALIAFAVATGWITRRFMRSEARCQNFL